MKNTIEVDDRVCSRDRRLDGNFPLAARELYITLVNNNLGFSNAHAKTIQIFLRFLVVIMRTSKTVNLLELKIGELSKDNCATVGLLFVLKPFSLFVV